MKLFVLLFGLLAVSASAAPYVVDLKFETLALRNGQTLKNGVIKSYDHANGKVVIHVNREITSLQLEMLPEEMGARVISLVPDEVKDAARQEKADRKQDKRTSALDAAAQAKQDADRRARATAEAKARAEQTMQTYDKENVRRKAKSLARDRADRYYRYEMKPGSGSAYILESSYQLSEPEEVPGWDRRYRIKGSVGLEYYDTRGRGLETSTSKFEVLVGPDSNGNIVALDFTAK